MMLKKLTTRYTLILTLLFSSAFVITTNSSCAKKIGCAINDGPKTNRDGSLKMTKGKSGLYSKKQRKKMKNK